MWQGPRRYELLWRHNVGWFDREAASAFLHSVHAEPSSIWELRHLLRERGMDLERYTDDHVIDEVATLIGSGMIVVGFREEIDANVDDQQLVEQPRPSGPAARPSPQPELPDPDTFTSDCDPATQARVLVGAAQRGAPFCEECERAKQEARAAATSPRPVYQPPPRDPPTLSSKSDAAAQARTLVAASQRGAPFCQECERARQEA
jgi:hypothetical protein